MLFCSGVTLRDRARAGVGCLLHQKHKDCITDYKFINERLMTLSMQWFPDTEPENYVITYAPNDDANIEDKDLYFDILQRTLDEIKGKIIILGDLNGRVGNSPQNFDGVIGRYGESVLNDNGERVLNLCVMNNLIICNTLFPHKQIHLYTREEPSKQEKSIIDYIMVKKDERYRVIDCRVYRGPEIGSDHYLLIMAWEVVGTPLKTLMLNKVQSGIKNYKFKDPQVQQRFSERVEHNLANFGLQHENLEEKWTAFKISILEAAREACGISKGGTLQKRTAWWTKEIRDNVKQKSCSGKTIS